MSMNPNQFLGLIMIIIVVLFLLFNTGVFSLEYKDVSNGINRGTWFISFIILSYVFWEIAFVNPRKQKWWKDCSKLKYIGIN